MSQFNTGVVSLSLVNTGSEAPAQTAQYGYTVPVAWAEVTERPTTLAGFGITDAFTQAAADARYSQVGHTHAFNDLTARPTDLGGYGITDAFTKTQADARFASKAHAESHATGGSDELTPADIGAAAADHAHAFSSLTGIPAAFAPASHASSHKTGGTDPLTPGDIGAAPAAHQHTFADVTLKPTTVAGFGITDAFTKTEADARFAPAVHTHAWAQVTSLPSTVAGYGITDAYTKTEADAKYAVSGHVHAYATLTGIPSSFTPALHKATHATGGTDALTPADIGAAAASHTQAWSTITARPTTLSGYGITDAFTQLQADARYSPLGHSHAYSSLTGTPSSFTPSAHKLSHKTGGSDELTPADIGAAAAVHSHPWSQVTATPTTVAGYGITDAFTQAQADARYSQLGHQHSYASLTGVPSAFTPAAHKSSHATGGPDALTPADIGAAAAAHTQAWSTITSTPNTLAGYGITDAFTKTAADALYSPLGHGHSFASLTAIPASFTPSAHKATHASGGTDPLTPADIGASAVGHSHTFAELTTKPTTLAGYGITDAALATHQHTFASLTSKPTTVSGFGITDAYTKLEVDRHFGATSTSGILDWNDQTNLVPGSGPVLLLGSAANGPTGSNVYFHPFNFEYASKTGTGNITQLAIPYASASESIYLRSRFSGTWSPWYKLSQDGHGHPFAQITATPTTLAGYGITDAAAAGHTHAAAQITGLLDGSGKIDLSLLPATAITAVSVVANQAAMLALTAEPGDVAVRTDLNKSFILKAAGASVLANWQELLTPTDSVASVNGKVGTVTLSAADVGAATAGHNHTFATLQALPTTIAGFGITDAFTKTEADARYSQIGHSHSFSAITGRPSTVAGYGITDAYTKVEADALYAVAGHAHAYSSLTGIPATFAPAAHKLSHKTGGSDELTPADIGAAAAVHSQAWSTITSTPTTLAGYGIADAFTKAAADALYSPLGHSHTFSSLSGIPATFAPAAHKASHATGGADELTPADIGAAPSVHTHAWAQVTGTPTTVAGYGIVDAFTQSQADTRYSQLGHQHAFSSLTGLPATFAPSAHKSSHATGGTDALTPADIGAAAASHTQAWSTITARPTTLSGYGITDAFTKAAADLLYSPLGHAHSFASLTGVPSTFAPSAHKLSHATGGTDALTPADIGAAAASHTQAWSTITSTPTTLSGYGITDAFTKTAADALYSPLGHAHSFSSLTSIPSSFTPSAHKSTHATGGTDALTPADIGAADASHQHTFASLTSRPSTLAGYGIVDAASATHQHTFASLTSRPSTLAGFGIGDAYTKLEVDSHFGATTAAGIADWNDVSNTRPGTGISLLLGTDTNGPGATGYFHALNFEYSSKNGTGNTTQLAIPYGNMASNTLYLRGRYSGAWSSWSKLAVDGHTHTFASLTARPTTLGGYGITDAYSTGQADARYSQLGHSHAFSSLSGIPAAFAPASHKASHAIGGSDVLTPADIGAANVVHGHSWTDLSGTPTTVSGYGITDALTPAAGDVRYSLLGHAHSFASLTGRPTTVAGYGISDASVVGHTHNPADITGLLGGDGKISTLLLPSIAVTDTFVVSSQAQMLALSSASQGDLAVRSDVNKTFILNGSDPSVLANWVQLATPTDSVSAVNGKTGAVSLTASDVGAAPTVHSHAWGQVTATPTTLAGYGITDAFSKTESDTRFAPLSHTHTWSQVTARPTTLGGYGITDALTQAQADLRYAFSVHTHSFADVSGQLGDDRLSANIPRLNAALNAFSGSLSVGPVDLGGTARLRVDGGVTLNGVVGWSTDNLYDLGVAGSNRPRNIWSGSDIIAGRHFRSMGGIVVDPTNAVVAPSSGVGTLEIVGAANKLRLTTTPGTSGDISFNGSTMTISTPLTVLGALTMSGGASWAGSLTPATTGLYDLGTGALRWRDLWLSGALSVDGNVTSMGMAHTFGDPALDDSTIFVIGSAATATVGNRSTTLQLQAPHDGSTTLDGGPAIHWVRGAEFSWRTGVGARPTGAVSARSDFFFKGTGANIAALSQAGKLRLSGGMDFTSDNVVDIGGVSANRPRNIYAAASVIASGIYGSDDLNIGAGGLNSWDVKVAGHLYAKLDNTYDIGTSSNNRPRDGFFARYLSAQGYTVETGGAFAAGRIYSTSVVGLALGTKSGTSYDFALFAPSGSRILGVSAGTLNLALEGAFTARGAAHVLGDPAGDLSYSLTLGSQLATPSASRATSLFLDTAHGPGFTGGAQVIIRRGGTTAWQVGVSGSASGAKSSVDDLHFFNGSAFVGALSQAGKLVLSDGLSVGADIEVARTTGSAVITPATIRLRSKSNAADWDLTTTWGNLDFHSDDGSGSGVSVRARVGARFDDPSGATTSLVLSTSTSGGVTPRWRISAGGHLFAEGEGLYDIGTATANRPRDIFVGRDLSIVRNATVGIGLGMNSALTVGTNSATALVAFSSGIVGQLNNPRFVVSHDESAQKTTFNFTYSSGDHDWVIQRGGVDKWKFSGANYNLLAVTDGTATIGAATTNRPLAVYASLGFGVGAAPTVNYAYRGYANQASGFGAQFQNVSDDPGAYSVISLVAGTTGTSSGYLGAFPDTYSSPTLANRIALVSNSDSAGLVLWTGGAGTDIQLVPAGTPRWSFSGTGQFLASSDNANDIGAAAANRPRNIYAATSVIADVSVIIGSDTRATSVYQYFNAAAGQYRGMLIRTAGVNRWVVAGTTEAESGANAGTNFQWNAYDDTGALIDVPLKIVRAANGLITMTRPLMVATNATTYQVALSGASTTVRQIQLGTTSNWSTVGTRYSGGDLFLAFNASQTAVADVWGQSAATNASVLLRLNSGQGFQMHAAPVGAAAGDLATFWGQPVFSVTTAGGMTLGTDTNLALGLTINSAASNTRSLGFRTANVNRWTMTVSGTETGVNDGGAALAFNAYTDAGAFIDAPLSVPRTLGGTMTLSRPLIASAGVLTLGSNVLASSIGLNLSSAAGQMRDIQFNSGGIGRWSIRVDSSAETGSNSGSNFSIYARDDAGAAIDAVIAVTRVAGGAITLSRPLRFSTDNTVDIGASGSNRPRDGFFGRNLTVTSTITAASLLGAALYLDGAAGTSRSLNIRTNGSQRWALLANATAESGLDAGSDLRIAAYTDAGALIDSPVSIGRASGGLIMLARPLTWAADNANDIGASGALRPRHIYAASSVVVGVNDGSIESLRVGGTATGDFVGIGTFNTSNIAGSNSGLRMYVRNGSNSPVLMGSIAASVVGGAAGTESASLILSTVSAGTFAARWQISSTGHWLAATDNVSDIGATAANRPRDMFLGRDLTVANTATIVGQLTAKGTGHVLGDTTAALSLFLRGAAGNTRAVAFQTGTVTRWRVLTDTVAEGGANAGSNFGIYAHDDAGTLIDAPITIERVAGGRISLARQLVAPASTATAASIRLPHGVAPTTPTNGDVWTTTTGVFARLNGATVQLTAGAPDASTLTGTTLAANVVTSSLTSVGTLTSLSVTGTVTAGGFSGNASTATALQTARTINGVSFNGTANITVPAAAGTLTGTALAATVVTSSLTSVGTLSTLAVTGTVTAGAFAGNASTATALQTARTINGVAFDGTANITVAAAAGTLTGATLAAGVTASSLTTVGTLTAVATSGEVLLAGSAATTRQVKLGSSSAWSTVGTRWSGADLVLAFNASQSGSADSWSQSNAAGASALVRIGAESASEAFGVYRTAAGTATGTQATFWGSSLFAVSTAGVVTAGALTMSGALSLTGSITNPAATVRYIAGGGGTTNLELNALTGGSLIQRVNGTAVVTVAGALITLAQPVTASSQLGVGGASATDRAINITGAITSGATQYGLYVNNTSSNAATTAGYGIYVAGGTAAAAFTMANAYGIRVVDAAKGAGSTITNNYGLYIDALTAGTNNWGLYVAGGKSFFGGPITIAGGTVTASAPLWDLTQTWNSAGVTFTGAKVNVTDTASAAASMLLDLQVASSSKFSVRKDGQVSATSATVSGALSVGGRNVGGSVVSTSAPSGSAPDGTVWYQV